MEVFSVTIQGMTHLLLSSSSKIITVLCLILLVSCALNPVTGKRELMLVSESQEISLGREAAPSLNWEFGGEYHDPELETYLSNIARQIWRNSERPGLPMEFHIQNTSLPNAFALPGYIAITRGLLSDLENEAQFAAIIGHEIGHVMARHTAQRLSRSTLQQFGLAVGAGVLAETKGADALLTAGALGSSLFLLKYDRSQEIQADRLGVKYMAALGYDPTEALRAHEILESSVNNYLKRRGKSPAQENYISSLMSTHPRTQVRIEEIRSMISELPPFRTAGDGRFSIRFQQAAKDLKRVNTDYFIYDDAYDQYQKKNYAAAEQKLRHAISANNGQAPFYNLLGFVKLNLKNHIEAKELFSKAISIDSGFQPSIYGLGVVHYNSDNYDQAIHEFKMSLGLFPGHAESHFGIGKSYFDTKRFSSAIPYLRNYAGAVPENPEVHGMLGMCYENSGEIAQAVTEYKKQIRVSPNSDLGRYAQKRVSALAQLQ